jgi:hypothetical protein
MKRSTRFLSLIAASCLCVLISCHSKDYKEDAPSPDNNDPSQRVMSDTSAMMNTDTSAMMNSETSASAPMQQQGTATNNNTTTNNTPGNNTAKTKKGKVSTVMMTSSMTSSTKSTAMKQDKQGYYSSVEILPAFPGGQKALDNFVFKNLEYSQDSNDNNI